MPSLRDRARLSKQLLREPARLADLPAWWRSGPSEGPVPWWPRAAVARVAERLPAGARVFEYGGGASTLWLAGRGAAITTVEHDAEWYAQIQDGLAGRARVLLVEPSDVGVVRSEQDGRCYDDYVAAITSSPDASYDLVIVDGRCRVACGLAARAKVAPGGMLLLDDSQRARYRPLVAALQGWAREDFRELKADHYEISQTSVFTPPLVPAQVARAT